MEYSKQLIAKAKNNRCKICHEYISEQEADKCDFQYSQAGSRREVFVHTKCLEHEKKGA